jgi:hypothetical protein
MGKDRKELDSISQMNRCNNIYIIIYENISIMERLWEDWKNK